MSFIQNTSELEGVPRANLVRGADSGSYARQNPRPEGTDFGHTLQNDLFFYSGSGYPAVGPAFAPELVWEPEQMDGHNDIAWEEWLYDDSQGEEYGDVKLDDFRPVNNPINAGPSSATQHFGQQHRSGTSIGIGMAPGAVNQVNERHMIVKDAAGISALLSDQHLKNIDET
ncbi:uncharacterized protein JN550_011563 [Neoarthrinium moseri]|uniref:uncharacterized protein n=1 Tax=Neoarthrinium moseri TaxID=1658444 RepID=UPI001FDB4785|nr:uncharacterized protein JN550_011563 [Neoarthrinium moseri]KAI1860297.1 hypothetical protein JN550_011563 [Neoarthrinium moseri]